MDLNMTAGLWVVMCRYSFIDCNKYIILMCLYSFIDCNKYTILMCNVSRGKLSAVEEMAEIHVHGNSVLSAQFCCDSKTALKLKVN